MKRPKFWSNLWHTVTEECDGLKQHVLWVLRKKLIKQETAAERAKRLDDWKQIRRDILRRSHSDLLEGSRPEATGLKRSFFLHLTSEATRPKTAGSAEMLHNSEQGLDSHIGGWAAHFLPVADFESFYVESVSLNVGGAAQAMLYAWKSVAHFRDFPRLVAHQTRCLPENYLGGVEDTQVRTKALNETRATIAPLVDNDLEKGRKASAAFDKGEIGQFEALAHRMYFEFFESETRRAKTELKDEKQPIHFLIDSNALSHRDYQALYARTIIANRQFEVLAAQRALLAARVLPAFPPHERQFDVCAMPRSL